MKVYIGAKIIQAEPDVRFGDDGKFHKGYQVVYPDGYVSWSPKETFETAYREVTLGERQLIELGDE